MKKILNVICFFALTLCAFANGGIPWPDSGIYINDHKIQLINDKDFKLQKEDLTIQLVEDNALVTCIYTLQNTSTIEKNIPFAFNIICGSYPKDCFMGYQIFENGKAIYNEQSTERLELEGPYPNLYSIWKKSQLHFEPNEVKQLKIVYKIKTNTYGPNHSCFFNRDNRFTYNLYPATSFGNGIIDEFNLTIDKTDIALYSARDITYSGIKIQNDPNELIQKFQFKNFDLKKNKEISIEYNLVSYYIANFLRDDNNKLNPKVSATSELKEGKTIYSASNINDDDYSTPWVEAKPDFGAKEKIHIEIPHPRNFSGETISHFYIVNGFRKNEKTYYENNRVKKFRLYINDKYITDITLPDSKYVNITNTNLAYEGDLINTLLADTLSSDNLDQFTKTLFNVKTIDIEILEVYPGTKYNDTCISEIVLLYVEPSAF